MDQGIKGDITFGKGMGLASESIEPHGRLGGPARRGSVYSLVGNMSMLQYSKIC
ncbi:hypothetical protein KSC_027620 [Ktedonobacter sp. SOSP1-52]|nr:hypothetical protein KSC_027620 [Ktedonobacter sp. SOSP1-52]